MNGEKTSKMNGGINKLIDSKNRMSRVFYFAKKYHDHE